ncbi:MAG: thioredoxin family protein [Candidatus Obscuribacterales bacterium]|nr:thioredoxin family protein [Candidatus Obscuribacterales bacterium]
MFDWKRRRIFLALAFFSFVVFSQSGLPIKLEPALAAPLASDSVSKEETAEANVVPEKKSAPVKARLVCEKTALVPGSKVKVALELTQEPGWHTYYKESGDAGMPTSIKWEMPAGFNAGEIQWPAPTKFEEAGLTTYGYLDKVVLLSEITVPATVPVGESIEIIANVKWLSCKDVCLPGKARLSLKLPVMKRADDNEPGLFGSGSAGTPKSGSVLDLKFTTVADTAGNSIPFILFSAFLGGMILNVMPCVLPVIAIKVMSFLEQAGEAPGRVKALGLVFSAGILASFLALALLVLAVKAAGQSVGWGFLFQYPLFVMAMAAVVLLFSLSLFGLFYFNFNLGQDGLNKLSSSEGFVGTFFKGVLATVLSTPCTAPFLGTALGFAFSQSDLTVVGIFLVAGLGMAFPYLLLTINPAWLKFLPKPGAWMDKFKQSLGFVLLGTVVWLDFVLASQVGDLALMWINYWLLGLAFCAWIVSANLDLTSERDKKIKVWSFAVLCFLSVSAVTIFMQPQVMAALAGQSKANVAEEIGSIWQPYSVDSLDKAISQGQTVFLDFTANWCLTCKVNETTVISSPEVLSKFKELKVVTMKADWTKQDAAVTQLLKKFGRSGVPLYVVFPGGRASEPIVLPEVITKELVLQALEKAASQ